MLREAFQALVLARLLIRQEQTYKGATWVTYVKSPDGRAALGRGTWRRSWPGGCRTCRATARK